MRLEGIRHIYFIGIGGIGMSALARLFLGRGVKVSGYDRTPSPLTRELEGQGIAIHYEDDPGMVPSEADLIIYTPAIPATHLGLARAREMGTRLLKRAEVLGELSRDMFTVAVAGTHGKTSITSMLAHILAHGGKGMTALVGGILKNYDSNLIISGDGSRFVVEADEYDRSFHRLSPDIALISVIDPDHLDVYGDLEHMRGDFVRFARGMKEGGRLLLHHSIDWPGDDKNIIRYAGDSSYRIASVSREENTARLVFDLNGEMSPAFDFHIPGMHNAENALGAAAMASLMGVGAREVAAALSTYSGVLRRFDIRTRGPRYIYIDDYAHHPGELDATIQAVRDFYPGRHVTGVFQPHLFSRTRDFAEGFAASLDRLDTALLMDIYPARELPVPGVDSQMLARMMSKPAPVLSPDEVLTAAEEAGEGIFLTLGAGDIDRLTGPLTTIFTRKETGRAAP